MKPKNKIKLGLLFCILILSFSCGRDEPLFSFDYAQFTKEELSLLLFSSDTFYFKGEDTTETDSMRYVYNNRDTLWAKIKTSIDLSWDPSFFGPSDTEGKAGFMIDSLDAYANIYMSKAHTNSNPYISFSVNFKENFFLQVFEETFFITEHRIGSLDSLHSYIDTAAIKGKVIEDVIKFQFDTMRFDHHFKKIYYKKGIGYILMETFDNEKLEALDI